MAESKIVAAVGVASTAENRKLGAAIEDAMAQAVRECLDRGIKDPVRQKTAMMAARAKVLRVAR